ncbi:MAG: CvpA family protein [Synergistaceae bacterium]|nr:CvpA family protein [Synergistaceae bacterium]
MLDTLLIFLCLYFTIRGISRGFIGEVMSNVGYIAACYFTFHFFSDAGMLLETAIGMNFFLANILGAIAIWFLTTLVVFLVKKILHGAVVSVRLGALDRLLGMLAGVVKTLLLVYLLIILGVNAAYYASPNWMTNSVIMMRFGDYLPRVTGTLKATGLLPENTSVPDTTLSDFILNYNQENLTEKTDKTIRRRY